MVIGHLSPLPGSTGMQVLHGFPTDAKTPGALAGNIEVKGAGRYNANTPVTLNARSTAYLATLNAATQTKAIAYLKGKGFLSMKPFNNPKTNHKIVTLIWRPGVNS